MSDTVRNSVRKYIRVLQKSKSPILETEPPQASRRNSHNTLFQKGGTMMAKEKRALSFTFVNPNEVTTFERVFRRVLIDRLVAVHKRSTAA